MLAGWTATAGLVLGLVLGGMGAVSTGVLVAKVKNAKIESLMLSNLRFEAAAAIAKQDQENEAKRVQGVVDRLVDDLEIAHRLREDDYAERQKELDAVASRTRLALSSGAVRVLNRGPSRSAAGQGQSATVAPVAGPSVAGDTPGYGLSERGMTDYLEKVKKQYLEVAAKGNAKSRLIEAARVCFDIVEQE